MPVYTVSRPRAALDTTRDHLKITASGTKPLRILKAKIAGAEAAAGVNVVMLMKSTGGSSPAGSIAPQPVGGASVASFTATYGDSAPSTPGVVLHRFTPNSNGGIDPDTAIPGAEFTIPVNGQVSFRAEQGNANVVINVLVEEIEG